MRSKPNAWLTFWLSCFSIVVIGLLVSLGPLLVLQRRGVLH
jgi:hypothetical protein